MEAKLEATRGELTDIENRMYRTVDELQSKYGRSGNKGLIRKRAEEVLEAYRSEIKQLDPNDESAMDALERLSFQQIDKFTESDSQKYKQARK